MILRILFLIFFLFSACSTSKDFPPPPSFPSMPGVGQASVSIADLEDRVAYVDSQFTARYSSKTMGVTPQQFTLEAEEVNVTLNIKGEQFVYSTAYLIGLDNQSESYSWQYYPLALTPSEGAVIENDSSKWVAGNASTQLTLDSSLLFDGVNHVLVWACHCDANNDGIFENECSQWQCNNNKWLALEFTALPSAICGNNRKEGSEVCDGVDATLCPGRCNACLCIDQCIPPLKECVNQTSYRFCTEARVFSTSISCSEGATCSLGECVSQNAIAQVLLEPSGFSAKNMTISLDQSIDFINLDTQIWSVQFLENWRAEILPGQKYTAMFRSKGFFNITNQRNFEFNVTVE